MIDVTELEMEEIIEILKSHFKNGYTLAFGSRYNGTNKRYSDLDLAFVKNDGTSLTVSEWGRLKEAFEESDLIYRVDVIDYWGATDSFRQIIDNNCIRIYEHAKTGD